MTTRTPRPSGRFDCILASLVVGLFVDLAAPHPARAQQAPPSAPRLVLEVGKGRLVRLAAPATGVFIGDPKVADVQIKSPTLIYLVGASPGQTSLVAVDDHDASLLDVEVDVGYDVGQLRQDLKRLVPGGDIEVSTVHNALVLSGAVGSAGEAETARSIALRYVAGPERLVNLLAVDAPNQINLRVRVVEVSRDIIKAFGINWTGVATPGQLTFGAATGVGGVGATGVNAISTAAARAATTSSTAVSAVTAPLAGMSGLTSILAGFQNKTLDLNAVIDALDSEGLVTVLAEPNLTAVSGATARFLAGGQYPIPVPQGLGQFTIEFKNYGVSLESTATIADDGRIRLVVKPEISQLSNTGAITLNGATVPALTTRRAETTVDLASGQSFAIAGLIQNNVTHTIQKVPGLGNIGGLGALFRSDRIERAESEILIVVTPYIVRPSSHRLAVPTDGYVAPTDAGRILTGADYRPGPPPPPGVDPTHSSPVKVGHP